MLRTARVRFAPVLLLFLCFILPTNETVAFPLVTMKKVSEPIPHRYIQSGFSKDLSVLEIKDPDSLLLIWNDKTQGTQKRLLAWKRFTALASLDQRLLNTLEDFYLAFHESNDPVLQVNALNSFGLLNIIGEGAKQEGFKALHNGLRVALVNNLEALIAETRTHLASQHLKQGNLDSSKIYATLAIDYVFNQVEDSLQICLLGGRLDDYIISENLYTLNKTNQAVSGTLDSFIAYYKVQGNHKKEIDILILKAEEIQKGKEGRHMLSGALLKIINRINETGVYHEKLAELEVWLDGVGTGNPKRISSDVFQAKLTSCVQPRAQEVVFQNPIRYSNDTYALTAVDSFPAFFETVEPSVYSPSPLVVKGRIDSILAGIPEILSALPGSYSENNSLNIKTYSIDQGLPVNSMYGMDQDADGDYWIGTSVGLVKYDGLNYYLYGPEQGLSDLIWPIHIDKKGIVWIGTHSGVIKFDGTYFISYVDCFRASAVNISEDAEGNIYSFHDNFGKGMAKYLDDGVEVYGAQNGLDDLISNVYFKSDGEMWVGTVFNGLFYVNGDEVKHFTMKDGLKGTGVSNMSYDNKGNLWFVNYNYQTGASCLMQVKEGVLYQYDIDMRNAQFSKPNEGGLWLAAGMSLLKIGNDLVQEWELKTSGDRKFVFIDDKNSLWIGSDEGLNKIEETAVNSLMLSEGTAGVIHVSKDEYWTNTLNEGVFHYKDGIKSSLKLNNNDNERTSCHLLDSKGRYWVGTWGGGLYMYDGSSLFHYSSETGIPNNWIVKLLEDYEGNIWFTTYGAGAIKFDGESFASFTPTRDKLGMIGVSLQALFQASDSSFWFSDMFESGICNLKDGKYTYYRTEDGFPMGQVHSFVEDAEGAIWATGEYLATKITRDTYQVVSLDDGFPELYGFAGIQDDYGNVWFAHQNNISVYNGERFITVDKEDGFKGAGHFSAFTQASKDDDGLIWFGANPAVSINPTEFFLESKSSAPTLVLTEILLQNKRIHYRDLMLNDSVKSASIFSEIQFESVIPFTNTPEKLILPHNINELLFQFNSYDNSAQHKVKTTYKLEGLSNNWSELSKNYSAKFTNLNHGDYCFVVKAQNQHGIWSDELRYSFSITPPWWLTWWAKALYLVFIGASLYSINKRRTGILKAQKRILQRQISEATVEMRKQKVEAEKQKEKAIQSEAFKQQFLANMSHEIRTPMNAIMGMTNLVLDSDLKDQQKFYLERVKKSADNLLIIINDILDLSKIEAGKMELEEIDFSLVEAVDLVKQTLNHKAEEKGLALVVTIKEGVNNVVKGDPVRINQILLNLTGNAIKFTEKGSVNILVEPVNKKIKFSIIDTGIGIPKDRLKQVFENFSQANADNTRKYGGTGLGLSIARDLVNLMGGDIQTESEVGSGTTFSFTIKLKPGSEARLNKQTALEKRIDGSILDGLRILITDDNEYNRIVARDTLKSKAKVKIFEAENGQETLDLLMKMDFDAILMDVQMPVMNGFVATKKIRELEGPKKNTPIIALTASVLKTDLDKCRKAGMDSYIPKPFKPQELISIIAQVLKIELRVLSSEVLGDMHPSAPKKITGFTDLGFLTEFCEGDQKKMRKYIGIYIKSVPDFVELLRNAVKNKDFKTIADQVHGFKTKYIMMGMSKSKDLAIELERACRDKPKISKVSKLVETLVEHMHLSINELEKVLFLLG